MSQLFNSHKLLQSLDHAMVPSLKRRYSKFALAENGCFFGGLSPDPFWDMGPGVFAVRF